MRPRQQRVGDRSTSRGCLGLPRTQKPGEHTANRTGAWRRAQVSRASRRCRTSTEGVLGAHRPSELCGSPRASSSTGANTEILFDKTVPPGRQKAEREKASEPAGSPGSAWDRASSRAGRAGPEACRSGRAGHEEQSPSPPGLKQTQRPHGSPDPPTLSRALCPAPCSAGALTRAALPPELLGHVWGPLGRSWHGTHGARDAAQPPQRPDAPAHSDPITDVLFWTQARRSTGSFPERGF